MKRTAWILGATAVIALGIAAVIIAGRFRAWQVEHSLATTHITYSHFGCTNAPCPSYQIDVFGDGTVIYQGAEGVAVPGAYIYHIPRAGLQAYIKDFRISSFWQKAHGGLPSAAGGCQVGIAFDRVVHRTGCLDLIGEDGMTLDPPQLSADVAQLEALTQLDALVKGRPPAGVTSSFQPVQGLRAYHGRRTFPAAALAQKPVL
ncbi:MAG: DUF6438 domain-containing protein [Asticcacaulis sp.]